MDDFAPRQEFAINRCDARMTNNQSHCVEDIADQYTNNNISSTEEFM